MLVQGINSWRRQLNLYCVYLEKFWRLQKILAQRQELTYFELSLAVKSRENKGAKEQPVEVAVVVVVCCCQWINECCEKEGGYFIYTRKY